MTSFDTLPARERIMVALDCDPAQARELAHQLAGHATWLKVGITLIYDGGLPLVQELRDQGFKVFVDAKFHDIPHQVHGALLSAARSGADLITVHASGGEAMLRACHEAAQEAEHELHRRPSVLGITVLTSMDNAQLVRVGVEKPLAQQAAGLAQLACECGLDGIVCSPHEAASMRALLGPEALIVTPGVRPQGSDAQDQRRVATPWQACEAGASHIVVGRPITQAVNCTDAFEALVREIENR